MPLGHSPCSPHIALPAQVSLFAPWMKHVIPQKGTILPILVSTSTLIFILLYFCKKSKRGVFGCFCIPTCPEGDVVLHWCTKGAKGACNAPLNALRAFPTYMNALHAMHSLYSMYSCNYVIMYVCVFLCFHVFGK